MERLSKNQIIWWLLQERNSGFEPLTFCLEGRHSTAELISQCESERFRILLLYPLSGCRTFGVTLSVLPSHQTNIRHNKYYVKIPISELNQSLQFTKLLHHHNAYRAKKGHECPLEIRQSSILKKVQKSSKMQQFCLRLFVCSVNR